ncbi:hypothetical protein ACO0LF_26740 [Undibacterium sp. Di27W]|uniref:hypothetical protein n=1 Tax=Undibacterium sp. Di27W TaxID=3413036 RepID=UPI003BF25D62
MKNTGSAFPSHLQASYPREYRLSLSWRLIALSLAIILIVGGMAGALLTTLEGQGLGNSPILLVVALILSAMGVFLLIDVLKYKIVLQHDAIEVHKMFSSRRLLRSQLQGRRLVRRHNAPEEIFLIPLDPQEKKIQIARMLNTDAAFQSWMDGITDLDAQEQQKQLDEIAADSNLGSSKAERLQRLETAKRHAKLANGAALVFSFWLIVFPEPYDLLVLFNLILPWLALLMMKLANGMYQLDAKPTDVKPNLALMIIMPCVALMSRSMANINLVNHSAALLTALACGLVLLTLGLLVDRALRSKFVMILFMVVMFCVYGYGGVTLVNVRLDHAATTSYQVQVLSKRISNGKSTSYHLQLAPWGPIRQSEDVTVDSTIFRSIAAGGMACVDLHRGGLHMPWYVVSTCP